MQNKALLYGLGAVALAVIGGAAILNMTGRLPGMTANVQDADLVRESTSLTELLARPDARQCSIETAANGATTEGMIYVAGGQMRGDFTTNANGQTVKSHLVVSNGNSYLWTDSSPQGFYLPFSSMSGEGGATSGIDASAKMEYACAPWAPEADKFALPTNITFQGI